MTLLLPETCRLCTLPLSGEGAPVCAACMHGLHPQAGPLCPRCGEALEMEAVWEIAETENPCRVCRLAEPPFAIARAYGRYDGGLREMIHLMKFGEVPTLATELAPYLAETMRAAAANKQMVVVAVPLWHGKRSFNQSEVLAVEALRLLRGADLKFVRGAMRRTRPTESQSGLSPHARRKNVRGAFAVAMPGAVRGREVLLVDDIYTTGATARECTRILLAAGATGVRVATLARSQRNVVERWASSKTLPSPLQRLPYPRSPLKSPERPN